MSTSHRSSLTTATPSTLSKVASSSPCSTCSESATSSIPQTQLATLSSLSSTNVISSTAQPTCTSEAQCSGNTCVVDSDCQGGLECQSNTCQPSQKSSGGLDTGTAIGIGVAVPFCIALIAALTFLAWRARRTKRIERQQARAERAGRAERKFSKAELEAPHIPLDDRIKRAEMEDSKSQPQQRVELSALNVDSPLSIKAKSTEPLELEDTSVAGQHVYRAVGVAEPPQKTVHDAIAEEEKDEVFGLYRPQRSLGISTTPSPLPSLTPPIAGPTPPPNWPLRDPVDSYVTQASSYQVVSPVSETQVNIRTSPVSAIVPSRYAQQFSQYRSRRSPAPVLPEGMIDRFDIDDDEEDEDPQVQRRPSHSRTQEEGRPTRNADREYIAFRWPSPTYDRRRRPR